MNKYYKPIFLVRVTYEAYTIDKSKMKKIAFTAIYFEVMQRKSAKLKHVYAIPNKISKEQAMIEYVTEIMTKIEALNLKLKIKLISIEEQTYLGNTNYKK